MLRKVLSIAGIVLLSGCSYIYGEKGIIKNRDTDYLRAETVPPLRIPPGLSSSTIETHYPVSDRQYSKPGPISLVPPELAPAPSKNKKPVVTTPPPAKQETAPQRVETSEAAPAKKRYLADMFKHPEYITDSFYPNKKTTTASSAPAPQTEKAAAEPVKQADNAPVEKKKRYIADYFR